MSGSERAAMLAAVQAVPELTTIGLLDARCRCRCRCRATCGDSL
jgi:hypothetical protein